MTNEQLLMLDSLAYFAKFSNGYKASDGEPIMFKTVGEFVNAALANPDDYHTCFNGVLGKYSDADLGMYDILGFVRDNSELMNLKIVYPKTANDVTTSSVCLVNPGTNDVYVIFGGNYTQGDYQYEGNDLNTWVENAMGATEADTDEQRRALDFYENSIVAARTALNLINSEDLNITVSGHSAAGNHSQYVTIAYEKYITEKYMKYISGNGPACEPYNANNDIDYCLSVDGQGFSSNFLLDYQNEIAERAAKITSICPSVSIVGSLMNAIPGINEIIIDIGFIPDAALIGYHMPMELLEDNGEFKPVGAPSWLSNILKIYSSSVVWIHENHPYLDADHAMNNIGHFIDCMFNGETKEGFSYLCDADTIALLGLLAFEVGVTIGITVVFPELILGIVLGDIVFSAVNHFIDWLDDVGYAIADFIFGGNEIVGNDEDNTLYGNIFADFIYGKGGNDKICGDDGDDMIFGGAGDDEIYGESGADYIEGGAGNDYINGGIGNDELYGGAEDDHVDGGNGDDYIEGNDGIDILCGDAGDDIIYGGLGNDELNGGVDNDKLHGDDGDDKLNGDSGDDELFGGDGNDTLNGGDDNDKLFGGADNDELHGGNGNDSLFGDGGDDILYGDAGDDYLEDLTGDNHLYGGDGDDTLVSGEGTDYMYGDDGNDYFIGGDGTNYMYGGLDNDRMQGGEGYDYMEGGTGDDVLSGGNGSNKMLGQEGNDQIYGGNDNDYIDGGMDDDVLHGGNGNNEIYGQDGNDIIYDGDDGSYIYGGTGNDSIYAGGGNDVIDGGEGDDYIQDDHGDDTIIFKAGYGTDTISDAAGNNTIQLSGLSIEDSVMSRINWSDLKISFGDDNIIIKQYFDGGAFQNFNINGTMINDLITTLHGSDNDDWMSAWSDNGVSMNGEGGNDRMQGGNGNDTLDGGTGNDWLYGGNCEDTYIFGKGYGSDVIEDWNGNSTISLTDVSSDEVTVSSLYESNLILSVNGTDDKLMINGFRWNQNTFTFEFADGVTGTVNNDTWQLELTYPESEETAIQTNADLLSGIYEDETVSSALFSETDVNLLADTANASAILSSDESDLISEQTDVQTIVLIDAMSGFVTESNISDTNNFANATDDIVTNQLLVGTQVQ